ANFAFVDGHCLWVKNESFAAGAFFVPSCIVTDPSQMALGKFVLQSFSSTTTQKGPHGMPYQSEYTYPVNGTLQWNCTDDTQPLCDPFGLTRLASIAYNGNPNSIVKGQAATTPSNGVGWVNLPSWLNKTSGVGGILASGNPNNSATPAPGAGCIGWAFWGYLTAAYSNCQSGLVGSGFANKTLTLTPTASGTKKIGVFVFKNFTGAGSVTVNSVTTQGAKYNTSPNGKPYSTYCSLDMSGVNYGFGLILFNVPMSVNQPVIFDISVTPTSQPAAQTGVSAYLVFED
ncbi:MAG TPA: hypothetical protein VGM23_04735, partial [Armatimonadota bacterium]